MVRKKSIWLERNFQLLATGSLLQNICHSIYFLALPLIIYEMTKSSGLMSLMAVLETLPQILLGPFIGTLVDRYKRKSIIINGFLLQFIFIIIIPTLNFFGKLQIWHVFLVGSIYAVIQSGVKNAQFTIIPSLFSNRKLDADAGITSIYSATLMVGGTIAGLIISILNPFYSLYIIGCLFLISSMTQYLIKVDEGCSRSKKSQNSKILSEVKEGFVYITKNKSVFTILVVFSISNLADNGLAPVLLYHLKNNLQLSEQQIGITMSSAGIGLLMGSFIAGKLKKFPAGKVIFYFFLLNNIGITMFLLPGWWPVLLAQFTAHLGGVVANILKSVTIQTVVPNEYLGRVAGTMRVIEQGTQPISYMLLGGIAASNGAYSAFIVMFFLTIISTIVLITSPIKRINIESTDNIIQVSK